MPPLFSRSGAPRLSLANSHLWRAIKSASCLGVLVYSTPSHAFFSEIYNYLNHYQVGADYANSTDRVDLSYETAATGHVPDTCQLMDGDLSRQRCQVGMLGGHRTGWGLFLQPAFKKQGFFYANFDVGFQARYLRGEIPAKDRDQPGLLLRNASFSLGAVLMKPYLQFGITPERFPDVLISMGPAIQLAYGTVILNDDEERVLVGTSSVTGPMSLIFGFFALEFVVKRFGDGAVSFMLSRDVTGSGRGTKIYPNTKDGMSDVRGSFSRKVGGFAYGFGLKVVTPWP